MLVNFELRVENFELLRVLQRLVDPHYRRANHADHHEQVEAEQAGRDNGAPFSRDHVRVEQKHWWEGSGEGVVGRERALESLLLKFKYAL